MKRKARSPKRTSTTSILRLPDLTIVPGDIIFTGSPFGSAREHGGCWLKACDHIHAKVEEVGELDVTVCDSYGESSRGQCEYTVVDLQEERDEK